MEEASLASICKFILIFLINRSVSCLASPLNQISILPDSLLNNELSKTFNICVRFISVGESGFYFFFFENYLLTPGINPVLSAFPSSILNSELDCMTLERPLC